MYILYVTEYTIVTDRVWPRCAVSMNSTQYETRHSRRPLAWPPVDLVCVCLTVWHFRSLTIRDEAYLPNKATIPFVNDESWMHDLLSYFDTNYGLRSWYFFSFFQSKYLQMNSLCITESIVNISWEAVRYCCGDLSSLFLHAHISWYIHCLSGLNPN